MRDSDLPVNVPGVPLSGSRGVRNPETDWLDGELGRQRLGLTDVILCEVLQGVGDDLVAKESRGDFDPFEEFLELSVIHP